MHDVNGLTGKTAAQQYLGTALTPRAPQQSDAKSSKFFTARNDAGTPSGKRYSSHKRRSICRRYLMRIAHKQRADSRWLGSLWVWRELRFVPPVGVIPFIGPSNAHMKEAEKRMAGDRLEPRDADLRPESSH
jgi:hypothetical protein